MVKNPKPKKNEKNLQSPNGKMTSEDFIRGIEKVRTALAHIVGGKVHMLMNVPIMIPVEVPITVKVLAKSLGILTYDKGILFTIYNNEDFEKIVVQTVELKKKILKYV